MLSYRLWTLLAALVTVAALARAIRDPDVPEGTLNLNLNRRVEITALTRARHPQLHALTTQLDDSTVTMYVRRIVTIVEGIERDVLMCVPGAARIGEHVDDGIVILPDAAVFDTAQKTTGIVHGEAIVTPRSRPTTELRNKLLDAALEERARILEYASRKLLHVQDPSSHVHTHELFAQLDRVLLATLKRIAVACAVQKQRLGLQYRYQYNGIYGADFISTDQAV